MHIFKISKFSIIFGDSRTNAFAPGDIYSLIDNHPDQAIQKVQSKFLEFSDHKTKNLLFLRQVHGTDGTIAKNPLNSFYQTGDYIITSTKNLGLGILTADCLPIIFYDQVNNIAAIAHAGWPGSLANIASKVIRDMQTNFGSKTGSIKLFFGPCAKVCCYQVQQDFVNKLDIKQDTLVENAGKIFFNLPLYNIKKLEKAGINKKNIDLNYNFCTICNINYCSYRREKEEAGRQMTIITLY